MTIRLPLVLALLASLLPIGSASPVFAAEDVSSLSCQQLWHRKNALLKRKGLCFREPQAIRTFGNAGCSAEDEARLKLTPDEREQMARIVLSERIKLCR